MEKYAIIERGRHDIEFEGTFEEVRDWFDDHEANKCEDIFDLKSWNASQCMFWDVIELEERR